MKITVIGTGYVGLTTGIGLADFGCSVCCVDINSEKIQAIKRGNMPFYEPGISEVLRKNVINGRLSFSADIYTEIRKADIIFITVGTPQKQNGEADISSIIDAAKMIGDYIQEYTIITTKSTVPVGTNEIIKQIINDKIIKRKQKDLNSKLEFDVVSNPEFLREGRALYDFLHPDRVVIGTDNDRPIEAMKKIYRPLYLNEVPFVFTDLKTAEIIKYSSNCFLATKVAFINEMARLCDAVGADIKAVSYAMGKDGRIGNKFLHPGPGYGGSCFPKDTEAIKYMGRNYNSPLYIVEAAVQSNIKQKEYVSQKILTHLCEIINPIVGILGVAFKSETDDLRESPAIFIINRLLENGIKIKIYDPQAMSNAQKIWGDNVQYCEDEYGTSLGCDGLVILTEWNQFRNLNLNKVYNLMKSKNFFDFRNIYQRNEVEQFGFEYIGMGR
jgi:UDPglucose 6-dehydrogenase